MGAVDGDADGGEYGGLLSSWFSVTLVLEHMECGSLRTILDAGHTIPVCAVASIAAGACRALVHLTRVGVLHRNLSPTNVWVNALGEIKL